MKTRTAVSSALALGALAVLLASCDGAGAKETSAAVDDSGLASMTVPGANASTVIEPRDTVAAAPDIPASTTPVTSIKTPKARAAAAKPSTVAAAPSTKPAAPVATPVSNTTTTPVTAGPAVTPTPVAPAAPVVTAPVAPVVAPVVTPPRAISGLLTLQTGSRLWFEGGSSVKDWSCKAPTLNANVVTSKADAAAAIVAGEKAVASVELTVPVMSLDCDNGTMDGHVRKALDGKAYPSITFSLLAYDLAKSAENVAVTLSGTLTIHGKSLPVTFPATAVTAAGGALRLTGLYELNMKDYGVKPPSLMLGTMNVRDKVKVRFDLLLND